MQTRQERLEQLYWEAYRIAQYAMAAVTYVPPGLDAEERAIYNAGLAGGDADRRQA